VTGKLCQKVLNLHCYLNFKCLKYIFIVSEYVICHYYVVHCTVYLFWCSVLYVAFTNIVFVPLVCVFKCHKGYHFHVSVSAVLFLLHSFLPLFYCLLPIWHLNMCCAYLDSSNVTCFTFSVQSVV
jgi:hypothetical protein